MIFTYNKNVGDTLLILVDQADRNDLNFTREKNISRIYRTSDQQTVGWNFFKISNIIPEITNHENGQIFLTDDEVEKLNQELAMTTTFEERISNDSDPKLVIGQILSLEDHPDSDHLKIAQVKINESETLQIVAGAPNVAVDQKVVVAKSGAQMPDGSIIWPGELRGVKSFGMLTSPRELHLPNAPQKKGILVLPTDTQIGTPFNAKTHWHG